MTGRSPYTTGATVAVVDWIDYRHSLARVFKRRDAGEEPELCVDCRTELDIRDVVHSPRCKLAVVAA